METEKKRRIRGHHVWAMFEEADSYNIAHKNLIKKMVLDGRQTVFLVAGLDDICEVCPLNYTSPAYNEKLGYCNPYGDDLILQDQAAIMRLKRKAEKLGIDTSRGITMNKLRIIYMANIPQRRKQL